MKSLIAVGFASFYGLMIRLLFGFFDDFMGIMTLSALVLAPLVMGFLTVYLIKGVKNYAAAFFLPWGTSAVILFITLFLNIEGSICWVMIYPLFSIAAGIGGIIALAIRKRNEKPEPPKNGYWGQGRWSLPLLLIAPAVTGLAEGDRILNREDMNSSESVIIQAAPEEVWKQLTNINEIPVEQNETSFSEWMGFPRHVSTTLDTIAAGGKRLATYEHGLYFNETIADCEEAKSLVLDIKTDPTKIPPTVMDEHILIGGKHVDILRDVYTIEKLSDNTCRLTLSSHFWINTPFNWYAGIWAKYLMSDILSSEIELIKIRSEEPK